MPAPRAPLLLLALAAAALVPASAAAAAAAATPPAAPEYTVDLDVAPAHRWDHILPDFQKVYNDSVVPWIDSQMPASLRGLLEGVFASVDGALGEFGEEIAGVSASVGVNLGAIVFMNLIYDLTAGCTSIVARSPDGKSVFHARNLDYGIPWLRSLTAQITFQRGGETAYRCTTFVGYVGCLTGSRDGAWSATVDERDDGSGQIDNTIAFLKGGQSIGWFIRSQLDSNSTFEEAVTTFSGELLAAPVYIIVAGTGPDEGAVVTRNRTGSAIDVWRIGEPRLGNANRDWYVLETNYDSTVPNPARDPRRQAANAQMAAMGEASASLDGMLQVLSTPPVLNAGTKYSVLISPAEGRYDAYVRTDAPDDVPYARSHDLF